MAFSPNGSRLVGNDGAAYRLAIGPEVQGDGTTPLDPGLHIITAVAASSGYPAPASGGTALEPGHFILIKPGDSPVVPETGDAHSLTTLIPMCDVTSWSLDFTSGEVDVSTFCDEQNVYEVGRTDVTGNLSGIVTIGETTDEDGIARRFITVINQDGGVSADVYNVESSPLLVELVSNERDAKGDRISVLTAVNLFGFSLGATVGDEAQTFESNMRFANLNVGANSVAVKPALYRFSLAE